MNIDKFIEETEFYANLDIWKTYVYSDIVNIIENNEYSEEYKDYTEEDIKNILLWLDDYISDSRQDWIQDEIDTISTEIGRIISQYREHCSCKDILHILVRLANDYTYE